MLSWVQLVKIQWKKHLPIWNQPCTRILECVESVGNSSPHKNPNWFHPFLLCLKSTSVPKLGGGVGWGRGRAKTNFWNARIYKAPISSIAPLPKSTFLILVQDWFALTLETALDPNKHGARYTWGLNKDLVYVFFTFFWVLYWGILILRALYCVCRNLWPTHGLTN